MDKHMLAFGAGMRTCVRKNISLRELHKLVPDVLVNFELERMERDKDWKTRDLRKWDVQGKEHEVAGSETARNLNTR